MFCSTNVVPFSIKSKEKPFQKTSERASCQNQNIIPTNYFGTDPTAAPVLGCIVAIYILVVSVLYMNHRANQARKNQEHFVASEKDLAIMESTKNMSLPNVWLSILPLLVVVCTIIFSSLL